MSPITIRSWSERINHGIIFLCSLFSAIVILGLLPIAILRYGSAPDNARFFQGFLLIFVWVAVGGWLMHRYQLSIISLIQRYKQRPKSAFVVSGIILACIEEAIACLATNLHGPFGDPTGQAYITASSNYFDLIFLHSVIVIVPLLIAWSMVLERYRFSVSRFFILFGVQGALAEVVFAGMQPALFPTWLLVYGLMVWLPYKALVPAFDLARERRVPGVAAHVVSLLLAHLGGVIFTFVFIAISHGIFGHPLSHFPPEASASTTGAVGIAKTLR